MNNTDILVKCENVSKKFCLDFKKSLVYGLKDVVSVGLFSKQTHHDQLRKKEFWAVKNISFELRRGECLGLIGHNGAGKSTLLKMLNGLINPDQGQITMRGRIGALIELGAGFNPILTGRENIYNNGAVLGFSKEEIDKKIAGIIEFSEIGEFIDSPVQNYSSGMKVRLGFAVAIQMEPDVLIIDEVLAVGDVGFRFKCLNAIGDLMKNAAVIFVSHSMSQIYRICSEVMLLDHGKVLHHSSQIGVGIDKYYDMFANGGQQVVGSGEVQVLSFSLISNNEQVPMGSSLIIEHGADLKVNFRIHLDKHIPEAMIQIVIWNQELMPVIDILGENLKGYLVNQNETGEHEISLVIPKLMLNAGKHTMSLIVNSPDASRNYCRFDNAGIFTMNANFPSGAHMLLPLNWTNN
jgi:lipopolysaccharide transport system ATP-binding protein